MQNMRISGGAGPSAAAAAALSRDVDQRKDSGRKKENERQRKVESSSKAETQKVKASQSGKVDDSRRQQQPQQLQKKKADPSTNNLIKNLELRVTNLTPGVFKHVLAERLRREFGTPCKVYRGGEKEVEDGVRNLDRCSLEMIG